MCWKNSGGWSSNCELMYDRLPQIVWNRQPLTEQLNEESKKHFSVYHTDTHFIAFYDEEDNVVDVCCSTMDDEESLFGYMTYKRFFNRYKISE